MKFKDSLTNKTLKSGMSEKERYLEMENQKGQTSKHRKC